MTSDWDFNIALILLITLATAAIVLLLMVSGNLLAYIIDWVYGLLWASWRSGRTISARFSVPPLDPFRNSPLMEANTKRDITPEICENHPIAMANLNTQPENDTPLQLHSANGDLIATYICVMTPRCMHCKEPILDNDGMFYALDRPYYALLHRKCGPYFTFNGEWPHEFPIASYMDRGKVSPR